MYTIGYDYAMRHHKEDALCLFQMITVFSPLVCDYQIALGLMEKDLNYDFEALSTFAMASFLNPKNPIPHYNSAEIYLKLQKVEEAKQALALLENISSFDRPDLKATVEDLKNRLQKARAD